MVTLNINGKSHTVDVEDDMPLLWVLREIIGMTGTKYGCGIAQCGACTVHLDGNPVRSCSIPASAAANMKVTTIEGLSPDLSHPVQKGLVRTGRAAMRLLPIGANHGRGVSVEREAQPHGQRYR
jgi:isoquinoline 1-oxidoreductase alpha subunit